MTALSASYEARRKEGDVVSYPLAANATVFKGGLVALAGGYAQAAGDTPGTVCAGVAVETMDNTGGGAGALAVRVQKTGSYVYAKAGAGQADVGKPAYVADDGTVSTAATANSVACGVVVGLIDSAHVRVRIDGKVS